MQSAVLPSDGNDLDLHLKNNNNNNKEYSFILWYKFSSKNLILHITISLIKICKYYCRDGDLIAILNFKNIFLENGSFVDE